MQEEEDGSMFTTLYRNLPQTPRERDLWKMIQSPCFSPNLSTPPPTCNTSLPAPLNGIEFHPKRQLWWVLVMYTFAKLSRTKV